MRTFDYFTFEVFMLPRSKERPRGIAGRKTFTPKETQNAEQSIRDAWRDAGEIRLYDDPIALRVEIFFPRPKSHFNSKGQLKDSAPQWVSKRPDGDNILKLVGDALNGFAWKDDALIAQALVVKRYGDGTPKWRIEGRVLT